MAYWWLAFNDRDTGHRVFPTMLVAFVLVQLPTFFLYKAAWWPAIVGWFASLPIP